MDNEKYGVTYRIFDAQSGTFYIGSTCNLEKRLKRHFWSLEKNEHHCQPFQDIWNKSTLRKFITTELFVGTLEEARAEEQRLILKNKNNKKMLNISLGVSGGDNLSRNPNKESILDRRTESVRKTMAVLSSEQRKTKYGRPGSKNGMFGRTHTDEVKKRLSERSKAMVHRRGYKLSPEQIAGMVARGKTWIGEKNPFYGKRHTEETKRKLSEHFKNNYKLPGNARSVQVGDRVFESTYAAAKALGIDQTLLSYRLNRGNKHYPEYRYVDKCPTTSSSADGNKTANDERTS